MLRVLVLEPKTHYYWRCDWLPDRKRGSYVSRMRSLKLKGIKKILLGVLILKGEKNLRWFEWEENSRVLLRDDPVTLHIQFTVEFV